MEKTCCMMGCYNNVDNNFTSNECFQFPTDTELCRIWVENCGDPQLSEDFRQNGVAPFLTKSVCYLHFTSSDFIDPKLKRLKPDAVPAFTKLNFVKVESDDYLDVTYTYIKNEPVNEDGYVTNTDDLPENFSLIPQTYESNRDRKRTRIADKYSQTVEQCFDDKAGNKRAQSKKSIRVAYIRNLETGKQEATHRFNENSKPSKRSRRESASQTQVRKYKDAVRAALRRSKESEEQRALRKHKNALRAAYKRSLETKKQRENRRLKDRIRATERRKLETESEKKRRRHNDAVRAAIRRNKKKDNSSVSTRL